jgi:hypothetical protein
MCLAPLVAVPPTHVGIRRRNTQPHRCQTGAGPLETRDQDRDEAQSSVVAERLSRALGAALPGWINSRAMFVDQHPT